MYECISMNKTTTIVTKYEVPSLYFYVMNRKITYMIVKKENSLHFYYTILFIQQLLLPNQIRTL